jgi:outer membrane protein OmpA-like peptidoglycan-associated protein/flagellar hook assembly protein FlgD
VRVIAGDQAFSPTSSSGKADMPISQDASDEVLWVGSVRSVSNPNAPAVRTTRVSGVPTQKWNWDGHNDAGALAPDGNYFYELAATDRAGNSSVAKTENFMLSTADTTVGISTDQRAFSPNGDRVKDSINFVMKVMTQDGLSSWTADVLTAKGEVVKSWSGSTIPNNPSILWDGKADSGAIAPNGQYTTRLSLSYAQRNAPEVATTRPFVLDTVPPEGTVSPEYTLFSPNGDGRRDALPFGVKTSGADTWMAVVTDSNGKELKVWNWTGGTSAITWNGKDDTGNTAVNGTYKFMMSSTDEAGNSTKREVPRIDLDSRVPRVFFTESASAISPKAGSTAQITFMPTLSFADGIESWELVLKDATGKPVRSFTNKSENRAVPGAAIIWNGKADSGSVVEGVLSPSLTVNWAKGDVVKAEADPITVDISGPALEFVTTPEFFSPDNDNVDDELFIALGMTDISPIDSWSLDVREPETNRLFYHLEGKGAPAGRLIWDGRSNALTPSELVQAASDYPYTFKATDVLGNTAAKDGMIEIDVLVIRDGENLKIAVPSIKFDPNAATFNSLKPAEIALNNRVLARVARSLNKFREYRVTVEGHANPVTAPNTDARSNEERTELVPLSKQRAQAVLDLLVKNGVARGRLSSIGMGGSRNVAAWNDDDNKWKNRRVEFILIK